MPLKWREIRHVGQDFVEYLDQTGRRSIPFEKDELREIYNNEFRNRADRHPNFSRVIYVGKRSGDFRGCGGVILFNKEMKLNDQWDLMVRAPSRGGRAPPPLPESDCGSSEGSFSLEEVSSGEVDLCYLLRQDRSWLVAEKYGIRVDSSPPTVDGTISMSVHTTEVCVVKLYIENTANTSVLFTQCTLLRGALFFRLEDQIRVTRATPILLQPGARQEVSVSVHPEQVGCYQDALALEFRAGEHAQPFHVVRFLEVEHSSRLMEQLAASAPFTPAPRRIYRVERFIVEDGERPADLCEGRELVWQLPLLAHHLPPHVGDLVRFLTHSGCSSTMKPQLLKLKALLESPLSFENYMERFQLLVQLEEAQMHVDIRTYDMQDASMLRDPNNKRLLVLKVPGVAENRPSVLRGDHLLVIKSKERHLEPVTKHKGYVHRVECEQVKLGFGPKLRSSFLNGMTFDVEFTINPLPIRLQLRAVELAAQHRLCDLLFPSGSKVMAPTNPLPRLRKIVTILKTIEQLYKSPSCSHMLACAPSNSAADLLCERVLEHVDAHQVYRLYASSRDPNTIPLTLRDCCNLRDGRFVYSCKEELMKYKILVTTVTTAGRLVSGGLPTGHFSHIFVDEAGHATEPDTVISVAGLLKPEVGQLVLAGDPKQLGPILRSCIAKKYGLEVSLLERLMKHNSLYQKDETGSYNCRYVTKLLRNYRSHESILKLPNELFYEGELVACADEISTHMYCSWEHLPKKGFPVIFHGVVGKDEREANSPSFFNRSEIDVVVGYLKKLLLEAQGKKGKARISPKDIGVIAPYRKQVMKIRAAIKNVDRDLKQRDDIEHLKVGSVEEFQGQERRVIIVSAVRSSKELLCFDEKFNIGFLKNEKRFNVAMTRAKALLIVVGNPIILRTDPSWGSFIKYCVMQGGYTGCLFPNSDTDEELRAGLSDLHLDPEEQVDTGESVLQQMVDPEWRNEQ